MRFKHKEMLLDYYAEVMFPLGLVDYQIKIKDEVEELDDDLAQCDVDCYEKKFDIVFCPLMNKANENAVKKVFIHELMHGLHQMYKVEAKICESAAAYEHFEEKFINHITTIIEGLL